MSAFQVFTNSNTRFFIKKETQLSIECKFQDVPMAKGGLRKQIKELKFNSHLVISLGSETPFDPANSAAFLSVSTVGFYAKNPQLCNADQFAIDLGFSELLLQDKVYLFLAFLAIAYDNQWTDGSTVSFKDIKKALAFYASGRSFSCCPLYQVLAKFVAVLYEKKPFFKLKPLVSKQGSQTKQSEEVAEKCPKQQKVKYNRKKVNKKTSDAPASEKPAVDPALTDLVDPTQ